MNAKRIETRRLDQLKSHPRQVHGFDNDGCARLLFCELRTVKGSNTTRRYRDAVLESLATLPAGLTSAGFEAMLEDPTCSQRTRDKVRCILDGVDGR